MSKILKKLLFVCTTSTICLVSQGLMGEDTGKPCCDSSAKECSAEACKDKDCKSAKCGMKDCHCAEAASSEMHHAE